MSWATLGNGICPPPPPEGLRFVAASSGYYVSMAIDNAGRMYAWGDSYFAYQGQTPVAVPATPNFTRHPATFRSSPSANYLPYPYQIGYPKSDWVDCQTVEYLHMAQDADGYLYAVGDDASSGSTVFGRGGWAGTSKYNISSNTFIPGGEQAIVMTLVNDQQWESFRLGHYHVLAQKADKSLWIWGKNLDNATYGTLTYANNYVSLTPIQMTWVPGPVKCFDAAYSVTAIVTESNQIYAWGDWANTAIGFEQIPLFIPFTVPSGTTILDLKCNYSGILILLSNGDAYGIGWYMGGTQPTEAMVFTKLLGGHTFTKIFASMDTGAAALDTDGVLWAWGNQSYLIVQGGVDDIVTGTPAFTGSANPSLHRWTDFAAGNITHLAIDDKGHLFSWGSDYLGMQGLGLYTDNPASVTLYEAVECGAFATLEGGLLAYSEALTSETATARYVSILNPKQLSAHDSCGHWHKKLNPASSNKEVFNIPACCWSFAVDIIGADVILYGIGITYPFPVVPLRYNIATRGFYGPYWQIDNFSASYWHAGAAISGSFDALAMFGGDVTNLVEPFSIINPRIIVKATNHPTGEVYQHEFPTAIAQDLEGRIAILQETKQIFLLYELGGDLVVIISYDYGNTYTQFNTWPITGGYISSRITRIGGDFYVAMLYNDGTIDIFLSSDGVTWLTKPNLGVSVLAADFNMWTDSGILFILCHETLYFSDDEAATFTARSIPEATNFGIGNGVSRDAVMFYSNKLEKTFDFNVSVPVWEELPLPDIPLYALDKYTTIRNSGDYAIYMKDNLFINSRIVLPVSQNFGNTWENVQTPFVYFVNDGTSNIHGEDDPRWKFSPIENKILLDPQYK